MASANDSYYRAAVGAFIINEHGELLVVHKHGYEEKWDLVKGGIDKGESVMDALRREIEEEIGINDFEVLAKSKISLAKLKPNYTEREDFIGQAWNNYWVRINKDSNFKVPNREIEKIAWIKIDKVTIKKYFKIHDEELVLQTFLPLEKEEMGF